MSRSSLNNEILNAAKIGHYHRSLTVHLSSACFQQQREPGGMFALMSKAEICVVTGSSTIVKMKVNQ